jgi:hypothetical protein
MHAPEQNKTDEKRNLDYILHIVLQILYYRYEPIRLHEPDFCLRIEPHILDDNSNNSSLVEVQADPLGKDSSV